MWFWWFLFACNLLYPLSMILGGWFLWKHCPKKICSNCGYRSRRSMRNQDTWRFANENCGRRWWKTGWILLFPTILVQIPFYRSDDGVIGWVALGICIVDCTAMLLSILPTEKALKNTFHEDGTWK